MAGFWGARFFKARFFKSRHFQPDENAVEPPIVLPPTVVGGRTVWRPIPPPYEIQYAYLAAASVGGSLGYVEARGAENNAVSASLSYGFAAAAQDVAVLAESFGESAGEATVTINSDVIRRSHNAMMFELAA
jgi:hypothetical protein